MVVRFLFDHRNVFLPGQSSMVKRDRAMVLHERGTLRGRVQRTSA